LQTSEHDSNCLDVVPELPVLDLPGAQKWFQDTLGFRTAWVWEDSFVAVSSGEVQLYLRKTDSPAAGMRCYLHVKDADRLYDRCKQHGARIVDELESKPWGAREFAVEAPGGHLLRIGHGEKRVDEISQFAVGIMTQFKVDFDSLDWQSPVPGARIKSYRDGSKQLRLVEFDAEFVEPHWCEKGHVGLVLAGTLEIDFRGRVVSYPEGSGIFIPPGPSSAHKARAATPVVRLVLVED